MIFLIFNFFAYTDIEREESMLNFKINLNA